MIFYAPFRRKAISLRTRLLLLQQACLPRISPALKREIFMRVHLIIVFLITCLIQVNAGAFAQRISLSEQHAPLKSVFKKIRMQSGFDFLCTDEQLAIARKVNIQVKEMPVEQVLEQLFKDQPFTYTIEEKTVVIKEKGIPATDTVPTAQDRRSNGRISGKVIDQQGEPLAGASIKITGSTAGVRSSVDGSYTLELPTGIYTMEISFIGFQTQRITKIVVNDNKNTFLNIAMKPAIGQMREVVITVSYGKASVEGLYARQKNSASIGDGISAEQMSITPDKNIGESLRRISGLSTVDNKYVVVRGLSERYNQALLNGQPMPSTELNRKQFSFDIIPSSMVDNIVVAKTITPDMSAEFGGGLVQVETKSIPAENFISLTAGTSINDQTAGEKMLSLERDNKRAYLGSYAGHRYLYGRKDWNSLKDIKAYKEENKDNAVLTNNWQPYYYEARPSQNYQLSVGHIFKSCKEADRKIGVLASIGYRNTQNINGIVTQRFGFENFDNVNDYFLRGNQYQFATSIGGVAAIGYTTKKHKISWQNVFTGLLDEQVNFGKGRHTTLENNSRAMVEKVQQTGLWQSQLKGEHAIGQKGIKLNWLANYTWVKRERPDNHVAIWKTVPDNFELPHNDFTVTSYTQQLVGTGMLRMYTKAEEKSLSWDLNAQAPFTIGITKNILKAGYAGWNKDRNFYVALLGDQTGMGAMSTYPSLPDLFSPEYGGGKNDISRFGDDYDRAASLHALYGMLDNRIAKKWRLVWGVRAEHFDMDKANQTLDAIVKDFTDRQGSSLNDFSALYNREKNWKFFPSANLTYNITPHINARLAYSKSIVRPDLRDFAYFQEYDFELGGTYGAGLLRSTTLNNYDARVEWFPGAGEVVSGSFFYKDIKYPMEIYKMASNDVYTLRNNYKSHSYGIEMEIRKSLSFIQAPVIRNLTIYGNFTALNSKVTPMQENINIIGGTRVVPEQIIGKEEKRPLMGQSNYVGNAGLYYNDNLLRISISYNAISNRMVIYEQDALHSQFEKPMRSLDAQIAFRFLKQQAEVKLNISNLLQESNLIYLNRGKNAEEDAQARKGDYSNRFLLYQDHDMLIQKLSPGRTLGLVLSYTFK